MKVNYRPVVRNQLNNPFWVMSARDKIAYRDYLVHKQCHAGQLSNSKDSTDQAVWEALTTPHRAFGRSPYNNNQFNTGISALGGAIDKLSRGDISEKQVRNIQPVLDILEKHYPDQCKNCEYVNQAEVSDKKHVLFEFE